MSAISGIACFFILLAPSTAVASTPALTVSPSTGIVGSVIRINGSGFPPNTTVYVGWTSENASWVIKAIPTPQVTGTTTSPLVYKLGTTETNGSGHFSVKTRVPPDYGGSHAIQAYALNGTVISPVAAFKVPPHFQVSRTSGPAGTPINITATGLGNTLYNTNYQLYWDNSYVGYMTAVTTGGTAHVTIYASGTPGIHYLSILEGYPGPGYYNPQQNPHLSYYFPPDIPFHANFTVTSQGATTPSPAYHTSSLSALTGLAVLAASLSGGALFVRRTKPERREAVSKTAIALATIVLVAVGGTGAYLLSAATLSPSTSTQGASNQTAAFKPVAMVDRPHITVPQNNATAGPRITVTPDTASVGNNVTVRGKGFAPGSQLPIVWTTRKGNNLHGYKLVDRPLRNVTAGPDGSFSFTMSVPPDVGGIHYIAAGNLTEHSNGTLFLQRTARLSTDHGPAGTKVKIIMQGVGWDYNTNIVAFDYDNSYVGYGCGFSSGGNVTLTFVATGAPGIHTIDVYPSIWWGPSTASHRLPVEYRYPLLTPHDHPELMPSFHFTFLVTPG